MRSEQATLERPATYAALLLNLGDRLRAANYPCDQCGEARARHAVVSHGERGRVRVLCARCGGASGRLDDEIRRQRTAREALRRTRTPLEQRQALVRTWQRELQASR